MRNYKRKTDRAFRDKGSLVAALKEIRNKESNLNKASAKYGIPTSTLRNRMKTLNSSGDIDNIDIRLGNFRPTFSDDQEKELMEHVYEMEKIFFGFSTKDMQHLAFQYAERNKLPHKFNKNKGLASRDWLNKFLVKHPELILKTRDDPVLPKGNEFTKSIKDQFFDLLSPLMREYSFAPSRIYAEDKVAFTFLPNTPSKVINLEEYRKLGVLPIGGDGTTTTAAICCNAAGNFIPPLIIFPRSKYNSKLEKDSPPNSCIVFEPSGCMQPNIFFPIWFNHFVQHAKPTKDDPVLLILNGEAKYVKNLNLLYAARENNVYLLFVPPHTSHKLQPITQGFIEQFRLIYSEQSLRWSAEHPGQSINISGIAKIFKDSYLQAAMSENAINGFKAAGIYPVNRDTFSEDEFSPPEKESEKDYYRQTEARRDIHYVQEARVDFQKVKRNEIPPLQREKAIKIVENIESQLEELKQILFSNDNGAGPSQTFDREEAYNSSDNYILPIEVPLLEGLSVKNEVDPLE